MKFRCQQSGTIVEFTHLHDVETMLQHPQYDVVEEVEEPQHDMVQQPTKATKATKSK